MDSSRVISVALALAVACAAPRVDAAPAIEVRSLPSAEAGASSADECLAQDGTWCDAVGWPCSASAGSGQTTGCSMRVADRWAFNEGDYCRGCRSTFYVVVECGREMHLPLDDMEGASISVTEVLTGHPVTLRCLNDAAKGAAPEIIRCVGPGGGRGYGPPFDRSADSGSAISWGFPDCTWLGELTCADIPPGGGTVERVSPGEMQTMDCAVSSPFGLCGVYRVDIESGGFEWALYANCDGSAAPQFQIFFDCSEAFAAFDPRPELALANLAANGSCPSIDVRFDVQNLGCSDLQGSVPVRISSSCPQQQPVDVVVPGPIPANGAVEVSVLFTASCAGTITVTVDPDGVIPECTESPGVASCNQASGVRSLRAPIECCAAVLDARASDGAGCPGELVTLDGSASSVAPCANPLYRWLDATGAVVQDWSPERSLDVVTSCPSATYVLEASCDGEPCMRQATATASCVTSSADAGADVSACLGDPVQLSAAASIVTDCAQPEYRWLFQGAEVRGWDPDPTLAIDAIAPSLAGAYAAEVRCAGHPCSTSDDVVVSCDQGATCCRAALSAVAADVAGCAGDRVTLDGSASLVAPCARPLYRWSDGVVQPQEWSEDARLDVTITDARDDRYLLDVSCEGESCISSTTARAFRVQPSASAGPDVAACAGSRLVLSGASSVVTRCARPEYRWLRGGVALGEWSPHPTLDLGALDCAAAGVYSVEVRCSGLACSSIDEVLVACASSEAPPETAGLRLARRGAGLAATWRPVAVADGYRVLRGGLDALRRERAYDHVADDAEGAGACDVGLATTWTDPDDATDGSRWYYLVIPWTSCGGDGAAGFGRIGDELVPEPVRHRTPSCP